MVENVITVFQIGNEVEQPRKLIAQEIEQPPVPCGNLSKPLLDSYPTAALAPQTELKFPVEVVDAFLFRGRKFF